MNLKRELVDIERRVKASGRSMAAFLRAVEMDHSTWTRWKQYAAGRANGQAPRLDNFDKVSRAARRLRKKVRK